MTVDDALAHVRRLCPAEVAATLERALRRPAVGHVIGALARGGIIEEQRTSGAGDPRAEREEHNDEREGGT